MVHPHTDGAGVRVSLYTRVVGGYTVSMQEEEFIVHTDGGSRGNPGPAACAFIIEHGGKMIHKESKYLGRTTNNIAEYKGVLLALRWIKLHERSFLGGTFIFFLDSELIVKQLNGLYRVKDEKLRELFYQINSLFKKDGLKIMFKNIPRNKNKIADFLVNKELDKITKLA
jgi:ribonuclease HI